MPDSKKDRPNPQQERAIESDAQEILLSAGAGSGKTFVLQSRISRLVDPTREGRAELSELLVLTFTNAAAASMKNKIRAAFRKRSLEKPGFKELEHQLDSADVTTFDAFALDLVQRYRPLLGLSPNLSIGDGAVLSGTENEFLEEMLNERYERILGMLEEGRPLSEKDSLLYAYLRNYCHRSDEPLRNVIKDILASADRSEDPEGWIASLSGKLRDEGFLHQEFDRLKEDFLAAIAQAKDMVSLYDVEDVGNPELARQDLGVLDSLEKDLRSLPPGSSPFEAFRKVSFPRAGGALALPKEAKLARAWKDKARGLVSAKTYACWTDSQKASEVGKTPEELVREDFANRLAPYAEMLSEIALGLWRKMGEYKRQNGVFGFGDIFRLALNALDLPRAREELEKNGYRHILVDECQDNNDLQYILVDRLRSICPGCSLFMVGDVKQSIYRFRKANPDLFVARENEFRKKGVGSEVISMPTNYRSTPEVIEGVNDIFGTLMEKSFGGVDYDESQAMKAASKSMGEPGYELLLVPNPPKDGGHGDKEDNGLSKGERRARYVAAEIARRLQEKDENGNPLHKPGDFAILLRTKANFLYYREALSRLRIPVAMTTETDLNSQDLVMSVSSLLSLLASLEDFSKAGESGKKAIREGMKHPFASLWRSYLTIEDPETGKVRPLSDDKGLLETLKGNWFDSPLMERVRKLWSKTRELPPSEGLERLVQDFRVFDDIQFLGDIKANYRKLLALRNYASTMGALSRTFMDFCRFMRDSKEDAELVLPADKADSDAVKLMTIHASKGLEFTYVFLPELEWKKMKPDTSLADYRHLLYLKDMEYPGVRNPLNKVLGRAENSREGLSELLRLFYVAITRAVRTCSFVLDGEDGLPECLGRSGQYIAIEKKGKDGEDEISIRKIVSFADMLMASTIRKDGSKGFPLPEGRLLTTSEAYLPSGPENEDSVTIVLEPLEGVDMAKRGLPKARPSKPLGDAPDSRNLLFGTKIHRALEVSDIKAGIPSPYLPKGDGDSFDLVEAVKRVLDCPLMREIREFDKVLKEYPYIDEEDGSSGRMDLVAIRGDEAIIVDYKTYSIDDPLYDGQLNAYREHLRITFPELKEVRCYLLSLLDPRKVREVKEEVPSGGEAA